MDGNSPDIASTSSPVVEPPTAQTPTVTPRSWAGVEGTPLGTPVAQTGTESPTQPARPGILGRFFGQPAEPAPTAESASIPAPESAPDLESIARGPQEGASQNPLEWIAKRFEIGAPGSNEFISRVTESLAHQRLEDSLANLTPNQQADVAALADGIAQTIRKTSGQAEDTTLKKNQMPEELKISFTKIIDDARRLGFLNQPDISFQEEKISENLRIPPLDSAAFTSENTSTPAQEAVSAAEPNPSAQTPESIAAQPETPVVTPSPTPDLTTSTEPSSLGSTPPATEPSAPLT